MFVGFSTVNRRSEIEVLFVLFNLLFHEILKIFFIWMTFEVFVMCGFKRKNMLEICCKCFLHFEKNSLWFEIIKSVELTFFQFILNGGFYKNIFHQFHFFSFNFHFFKMKNCIKCDEYELNKHFFSYKIVWIRILICHSV